MSRRLLLLAALAALCLPGSVQANTQGLLRGRVIDRLGEPIKGAQIVILPVAREASVALSVTGSDGRWLREGLGGGAYRLIATKLGYASEVRREVLLEDGGAAEIDFTLTPADVASDSGERDLTWLVRSLSDDVLRFAEPIPSLPRSEAGDTEASVGGWLVLATAGNGASTSASLDGNIENLFVPGQGNGSLRWFLDGELETLARSDLAGYSDDFDADRLRYGVSLEGHGGARLRFDGHYERAERRLLGLSGDEWVGQEELVSYRLGFSDVGSAGRRNGVVVDYREARSDSSGDIESHSMLLTRGAYNQRFGPDHELAARVELTTQSFSRPNGLMYAFDSDGGMLASAYAWLPAEWWLRAAGEHHLRLASRLTLSPGLALLKVDGGGIDDLLQPRLSAVYQLNGRTALGTELSYTMPASELDRLNGRIGYALRLDRNLGQTGRLSIAARMNSNSLAPRGLENGGRALWRPDFLLLPDRQTSSRELAVGLDTRVGVVAGRVSAVVGEADGELLLVSLDEQSLNRDLQLLGVTPVQYVITSMGTTLASTETNLDVSYRWAAGLLPAGAIGGEESEDYARIDLRLRQGLPWLAPPSTRVELRLNLRSYLARPLLLAAGESEPSSFNLIEPHLLTGGVAILF